MYLERHWNADHIFQPPNYDWEQEREMSLEDMMKHAKKQGEETQKAIRDRINRFHKKKKIKKQIIVKERNEEE
jgi:hypothetical protein